MKYKIFIILTFFFGTVSINASSSNITGKTTIEPGNEITATINLSGVTNIMGLTAKLNYDQSKLTLINSTGTNGYSLTLGSNIVLDSTTGRSGSFSVATLTFRATSTFYAGESTTISISNVNGSDGVTDIPIASSSLKVTVVAPKSTNNNLSDIKIDGKTILGFSSSKTSYNMTVENSKNKIELSATLADTKSQISGVGSKNLAEYANTFYLIVTAENGTKKTYTINVLRKDQAGRTAPLSTNNNISSIVITGYDIVFNKDNYEYLLDVTNEVETIEIIAIAEDSKTTVTISDTKLKVGMNEIKIESTSEDGAKKQYIIKINRKSDAPVTTISEINNIINKTTSKIIEVEIKDNQGLLEKDFVQMMKDSKKQFKINHIINDKLMYSWSINGDKISDIYKINTNLKFITPNKNQIDKLTNYSEKIYLNFEHEGVLPKNTKIKIYVGNKYLDGEKINLYYYENKITKIKENIEVKEGYVEIEIEKCSEYFLTKSTLDKKINIYPYIVVVEAIIIAGLSYQLWRKRNANI